MDWLQQNWLYLLLAVGVVWMFSRGGMGCGMGGHRHGSGPTDGSGDPHAGHQGPMQSQPIDPVSRRPVDPGSAVSAVYRGVPVYFESRENRDRFEAAPDQFPMAVAPQPRRHHGC